jgi:hypothetical protein
VNFTISSDVLTLNLFLIVHIPLGLTVVRQLCDSFKLRRMFGVFTVDFLVEKESGKSWVLGIDPYLNDFAASFHLFDLLMAGSFLPESQLYLVEDSSQGEEAAEDRLRSR